MSEENNNEEQRPTKMRGVAFPKAKYGVILAVIIIIIVSICTVSTILRFQMLVEYRLIRKLGEGTFSEVLKA